MQAPVLKIIVKKAVNTASGQKIANILSEETGLSKVRVKDAMNKGAVWVRRGKKMSRIRKASATAVKGTYLEMHYDERLLSLAPPVAKCLLDMGEYSGWLKPAGLMSQGTSYGDHCAITRQAEWFFIPRREIFLVHRLDREVAGVMLVAHSKKAATALSSLFRENRVEKRYRAEVLGDVSEYHGKGKIALPLDGKHTETLYEFISFSPEMNTSRVEITLVTGRFHQIRRHFDMIGYPVMGDPRYGQGNRNSEGMKLEAVSLRFECPFSGRKMEVSLPEEGERRKIVHA